MGDVFRGEQKRLTGHTVIIVTNKHIQVINRWKKRWFGFSLSGEEFV